MDYTFDNDTGYDGEYYNIIYKNWELRITDTYDICCVVDLSVMEVIGIWEGEDMMDFTSELEIKFEDVEYYKDEPFYNALKIFILINTEAQEKEKSEK